MSPSPESRTTSTEAHRRALQSALTLAEAVIALGIAGVILIVLVTISMTTGRSLAEMFNYVDLDHNNRIALDVMTRDLRQVRYLTAYQTNSISFLDHDSNTLTFAYSPTNRLLTRAWTGRTNTLLHDCDFLRFDIYQRTPQSNTYALYTASDLTNCKVVSITWSCSRSIFGIKANTEQGQTARIVIRNKKEEEDQVGGAGGAGNTQQGPAGPMTILKKKK